MVSTSTFLLALIIVSISNLTALTTSQDVENGNRESVDRVASHFRRILQDSPGKMLGRMPPNQVEQAILRKTLQNLDPSKWAQFTPAPLAATEEPSCYVELQVTQRMPGRCTKLGGKIPACQSNDIVTIDYGSCE